MKINSILFAVLIGLIAIVSCKKDFLQRDTGVDLALGDVFADPILAGQYADRTYNFRIDDYGGRVQAGGQPFRGSIGELTDESVSGSRVAGIPTMWEGDWLHPNNAIEVTTNNSTSRGLTPYVKLYAGIRNANTVLENIDKVPWDKEPKLNGKLVKAQMLWLRAYFYFELAKRWGGVPILNNVLTPADNTDIPRNTYEEVIAYIEKDINEAEQIFESTTVTNPSQNNAVIYNPQRGWNPEFVINPSGSIGGDVANNNGRADLGATLALKSRVLLYAASENYNRAGNSNALIGYTGGDRTGRWQKAANASKKLIDLGRYSLQPRYQDILEVAISPEHIMIQIRGPRIGNGANFFGSYVIPFGYGGNFNGVNPTQNHVDLYEMINGKRITDEGPGITYNPQNPYTNRDPRLNHNVLVNGRVWKGRPVEAWREPANAVKPFGLDAGVEVTRYTVTGYYCRKMWPEQLTGNVTTTALLHYIYFRYGEILLNYAEAINEVSAAGFAMAVPYVDQIRQRAGMPAIAATMAARGTTLNQATMRDLIYNERAVELAFEDNRWWDIFRWKKGIELVAQPMKGMDILKQGTTLTYTPFALSDLYQKKFQDHYHRYPIARAEINKSAGILIQNPGW